MTNYNQHGFALNGEALQTDFLLLLSALDASVSGIILTDNTQPDNPIIYCNAAFEHLTGYSKAEIIGHNCRFLQKQDRAQHERQILKDAIAKGTDCKVEIRNYRKNGDLFWNELYISPVKSSEGKVTHFVGVQHDVTQRKKLESDLIEQKEQMELQIEMRTGELKDSQAFLESIIQTVREGLLVLDPQFRILSVNTHFLKTFKVSRQETRGQLLYDLGNGQWNIQSLKDMLIRILPTNNPVVDFEVEHDFPHIGKKLMLLNAYRIELEGQYKDQILLAVEDITDRREIERRKDDFLSIASHELKTPLAAIKGFVQVLERLKPKDVSEKFNQTLSRISKYIDRLNSLITELLDVSKIQSGLIELHHELFDFDHMIAEAIDNLKASADGRQITLNGKLGLQVYGDESQIVQVINNLVSNAIKYAPQATGVEVYVSRVGEYVKVAVTDHGLGISTNDQKKVFERFFRSGEIQKHYSGMGLGLYICQQIIKSHGGTIWVMSEKNVGSTFSFTLPIIGTVKSEK